MALKDFLDKAKKTGREIAFNLAAGMQKVNEEAFTGYGENVDDAHRMNINKQAESNRVAKSLLQGELTQAVKELAYRTALIDEKSKDFECFSPTLALKYDNDYFNEKEWNVYQDGKKIKLIQDNRITNLSIAQSFKEIGVNSNIVESEELLKHITETGNTTSGEQEILAEGKVKMDSEHRLTFRYNGVARFKFGKKVEMLVVKEDGDDVILEVYVSKYPNQETFTSKPFVREIERIKNEGYRSTLLDVAFVDFITFNSGMVRDNLKYAFKFKEFIDVIEFEGSYILRFKGETITDGEDIMKPLYCEEMADKYRRKAPKDYVMHISPHTFNRSYVCEECGRTIKLDLEAIESMKVDDNTEIDENGEYHTSTKNLEYYDIEVIEQTIGRRVCPECFRKIMENIKNL